MRGPLNSALIVVLVGQSGRYVAQVDKEAAMVRRSPGTRGEESADCRVSASVAGCNEDSS